MKMTGQVFARDVVPSQDLGHQGFGKKVWEVSTKKWARRTDESGNCQEEQMNLGTVYAGRAFKHFQPFIIIQFT